jgi:tRNA modification GTPase
MYSDDTIAAISTPPGRGGIGIVRISGPTSLQIATSFFCSQSTDQPQPNRAQFGRVVDPDNDEFLDEVILTFFKAPHSYTGEDLVEISCHGSPIILGRLLEMIIERGARIAEPGEFTLRAFYNKRIDLAQAQAVRDVINAQTLYQARVAVKQLEGELSSRLSPAKTALVEVIVQLESSLEFVGDDISPEALSSLSKKVREIIKTTRSIAASFTFGRLVKEGFELAIVGRPNVGKSSVFNRLIGVDRAIVTELPGTTRDTLHETASIKGIPVRLVDTAGIRNTIDPVETLGIGRTRTAIADADISLVVFDASYPINHSDIELLTSVPEPRRILALNKIDLLSTADLDDFANNGKEAVKNPVRISALTGAGFDRLVERIVERLSGDKATERDDIMLTDARQYAAVSKALEFLESAFELLQQGELEEIILLKLRGALSALGEITGETLTEDILGQIFSTFCIGK